MFSLSLRRPFQGYSGGIVDCLDPWNSQPTMDVELPVMMRQLDDLSREFFGDHRGCDKISKDKPKKFDLKLDMRVFRPEDIKIKVEGDQVIVEAKREEKEEKEGSYSYSLRELKRCYPLPEGVDKTKLSSALTRNGVLEIEAPLLNAVEETPDKTSIAVSHVEETRTD